MSDYHGKFGFSYGVVLICALASALGACSKYYSEHPDEYDESTSQPFILGESRQTTTLTSNARAPTQRLFDTRTVTVEKGQTVYALSRLYAVPPRDIIAANRLRPPFGLQIGQRVIIPARQYYVVKAQDTSYSIARAHGVKVSDLVRQNGIKSPYILQVGQRLSLPGGARYTPVITTGGGRAKSPPTDKTFVPPPRTGSRFAWPLSGTVISRFGVKADMQKNEGINIRARQGSAVKAAEAGVVVFASDALESYGNLLLVKHAEGWLTAYAHNAQLLVREGQQVNRGQTIARVGSSGKVKEPQLHFEVRRGRTTYDPLKYLARAS